MKLTIAQRLELLRYNTALIIALGFLAVAVLLIAAFALGYYPDPMNARDRGPGWECDRLGKGAVVCDKDVPIPKHR